MAARVSGAKKGVCAKLANKIMKQKAKTKKGNPSQSCYGKLRARSGHADQKEDMQLSKAIHNASEAKVAAKLLQAGKSLNTAKDVLQKGKDINRIKRRDQVKKKVGRTEENYNKIKARTELRDQ